MNRNTKRMIGILLTGTVLTSAQAAMAQDDQQVDEVVVTASRVNTQGFTAPTPTTVIGVDDVQRTAPVQISESLAQMPAFRTSTTSSSPAVVANLRAIGATRTLVLVDGRRHVPTQGDGTMDLNLIPTSLISRTEIVTGGASASWGSDAVAGVVNLILDTRLQGYRGSAQVGQSKYGDATNYSASIAWGGAFMDDKARIVAGAEYSKDKGVRDLAFPTLTRPWAYEERGNVANPNSQATNPALTGYGQPGVIYSTGVRRADTSVGGLITNPLTNPGAAAVRGTMYGPNATISQFGYGAIYSNNMIGGTSNFGEAINPGSDIRYPFERYSALAHAEYDLSDKITLFAEGSYEHSLGTGYTNPLRFQGIMTGAPVCTGAVAGETFNGPKSGVFGAATGAISINQDNAFIPAATKAVMTAAGVSCLSVGRTIRELPPLQFNDGAPNVWRGVVGAKGTIGETWDWDAYYQYGRNHSQQQRGNNADMAKFRLGIDAVVSPTGAIVCRSTLTNPSNGCVPINIFGETSITPAMAAYFIGTSSLKNEILQQVASVNIRGDMGATWAGPIAVATGAEYRKEEIEATVDANSAATLWQTGSRKAFAGNYDVREAYVEAVVPLLKDVTLAKSLGLNGAARYTDYSSSGGVTTWKIGSTWEITDEVRLRGTVSQDIRAGNLIELFTAAATALQNVRNPISGFNGPTTVVTSGNRTLAPEEARTTTMGAVYSPKWIEGLRMSLDYYKINIDGVIGTLTAQQTVNRCYLEASQQECKLITTDANGVITQVNATQVNLNKFETNGYDYEIAYRTPLERIYGDLPGTLGIRLLATHVSKLATTAAIGAIVTDPSGQYNVPHDSVFATFTYDLDRINAGLELRWYEGGTVDNTLIPGLIAPTGINIAHVPGSYYAHVSGSYDLDDDGKRQIFFRINNLLDKAPPFPSNGGAAGNTGGGFFDEVGRAYRIGIRFKQ